MKTEAQKVLGLLIKGYGIRLERIADRLGVSSMTIYRWGKGTTEPRQLELEKLNQILHGYESRKK